jgi:hypothetical protein
MDLITLHGTLAIAPLAMISAEDRHLVRFPRLGKVAVLLLALDRFLVEPGRRCEPET